MTNTPPKTTNKVPTMGTFLIKHRKYREAYAARIQVTSDVFAQIERDFPPNR